MKKTSAFAFALMFGAAAPDGAGAIGHTDAGLLPQEDLQNNVFFPGGGTDIDATAQAQISELIQVLNSAPLSGACLKLVGHADTSGDAAVNASVAQSRAEAVANALRTGLDDPGRIHHVATSGESEPLPSLPGTHPLQRRVTLMAKDC